jgi:hypothetical protein
LTKFPITRFPQFSGYWSLRGNPKIALEAYTKAAEASNFSFLASYVDRKNGVFGIAVNNMATYSDARNDDIISNILSPYRDTLTISYEKTPDYDDDMKKTWMKKNWPTHWAQLNQLSLTVEQSNQIRLN